MLDYRSGSVEIFKIDRDENRTTSKYSALRVISRVTDE